jgi:hypothetical protein
MGSIASPPITINSQVNATLGGKVEALFTGTTVQIEGLGGAIDARIKAGIGALVGSLTSHADNSAVGFDGRSSPQPVDSSARGIGHQ